GLGGQLGHGRVVLLQRRLALRRVVLLAHVLVEILGAEVRVGQLDVALDRCGGELAELRADRVGALELVLRIQRCRVDRAGVKSAIFLWHLITARMAVPKALLSASPHFRVAATPPDGSSLVCGTQPVSSLAHDTPDPPSLQSKCWPAVGGAATAAPAATRKNPPMTDPRSRFMRPPPLAYISAKCAADRPTGWSACRLPLRRFRCH